MKIATGYTALVVNLSLPAATLPELLALLKAQPDKFNYSSGGFGANARLTCSEKCSNCKQAPYSHPFNIRKTPSG